MSRVRSLIVAILVAAPFAACQTRSPVVVPAGAPAAEIARFVSADGASAALRERLAELASEWRRTGPSAGGLEEGFVVVPSATRQRLTELKREYFRLREALFELALLNASAIVERGEDRESRAALLRVSVALFAGTDLVRNFHALADVLADARGLRQAWDEADPAHGIPEGSWRLALDAYRNARYHDLFRQALERLARGRRALDGLRRVADPDVVALFPDGVEPRLDAARGAYALLRARFAEEDLAEDEQDIRRLVERSRAARAAWAALAPDLRGAIARDHGLVRGDVHLRVQTVKQLYLDLREGLYPLAFKHAPKLRRTDVPYPETFRMKAIGISLLAAITLYDNAHAIETHMLTLPRVRALLDQGDPALGIRRGFWTDVQREFVRAEYRAILEAGVQMLESAETQQRGVDADAFLTWLTDAVRESAGVEEARRDRIALQMAWAIRQWAKRALWIERLLLKDSRVELSKLFGNTMGAFEFRKGKLYDQPAWTAFVKARLRPGDLLLERTPFRLTDKFIPGHFGHVAIYVGTVDELRALDLDRHPWVARHLAAVRAGRTVVEALRDGTQINAVEHFLNIDDLAILRPKPDHVSRADVLQAITLAFAHVGKKYDFAFDNNTWDSIVCSELAFQTYVNVRWPFAKVLSSYTISPDDVAVVAGSGAARPFELITFVRDGRVVYDRLTGVGDERVWLELLAKRSATVVR